MSAVLVVGHADRPEARRVAAEVGTWLAGHGHRVVATEEDVRNLGLGSVDTYRPGQEIALALGIGGDGTILRTVRLVGESGAPIIGVNVGLLGYLAEVEPPDVTKALDDFFGGRATIERRAVLDVAVTRSGSTVTHRALNEVSLEKLTAGHTVRLSVEIDGAHFTTYQSDGMIVATPTGSTAYSLSARGPIVSPRMRAIVVTPLSPHMLFDRSLVLGPDEHVAVEVTGTRPVGAAVDGEFVGELVPGDRIVCGESSIPADFVRFEPARFHQVLKAKFGLADR